MSRVKRLLTTDRIFFVTANLRKSVSHLRPAEMIGAIEESRRKPRFRFYGYVLMPDHWHALIGVDHPLTISRAVQDVKRLAARRIGKLRQTSGSLWQHQFWDRFVRHGKEFRHRREYMHLNPVRKGLVDGPEKWNWSSYNNFSLDPKRVAQCPIQIDYFGPLNPTAPEACRGYPLCRPAPH